MKTKNSYPSSEFEQEDRCPFCGNPVTDGMSKNHEIYYNETFNK